MARGREGGDDGAGGSWDRCVASRSCGDTGSVKSSREKGKVTMRDSAARMGPVESSVSSRQLVLLSRPSQAKLSGPVRQNPVNAFGVTWVIRSAGSCGPSHHMAIGPGWPVPAEAAAKPGPCLQAAWAADHQWELPADCYHTTSSRFPLQTVRPCLTRTRLFVSLDLSSILERLFLVRSKRSRRPRNSSQRRLLRYPA